MQHECLALVPFQIASPPATDITGPGWYESSWDLRRGLDVDETGCADERPDFYSAPSRLSSPRTARPRSITAIA